MSVRTLAVFAASGIVCSGCYSTARIKPESLPDVTTGVVGSVVSGEHRGEAIAVSVGYAEGVDGRMVEVEGEFDATVIEHNGRETRFEHPVRSSLNGEMLEVAGGNRARTSFRIDELEAVETEAYDGATTGWVFVGTGIAVVVGVITAGIIYAVSTANEIESDAEESLR